MTGLTSQVEYPSDHKLKSSIQASTQPLNYCQLLSIHSERICEMYSFKERLVFKELQGGIVNPPVVVFKEEKGKEFPKGVFKAQKNNDPSSIIRLKILEKIQSNGFSHIPKIFKNKENDLLTKIGNTFFYFIQFLSTDPLPISFENFLSVTGDFHQATKEIPYSEEISKAKLDEFKLRSECFLDPWFQSYDTIFQDPVWEIIVSLSQQFIMESFQIIYKSFPKQLIHGDNNQTNIIVSNCIPYFIDFDSLRFDVRLLDIASYFRYGGFNKYLELTEKKELFSYINATYGIKGGKLTENEEFYFHLIIIFSHIEFLSWALGVFKKLSLKKDQGKAKEFYGYILLYKDQICKIIEVITKTPIIKFSKESISSFFYSTFLFQKKTDKNLFDKERTRTNVQKPVISSKFNSKKFENISKNTKNLCMSIVKLTRKIFNPLIYRINKILETITSSYKRIMDLAGAVFDFVITYIRQIVKKMTAIYMRFSMGHEKI